MIIETFRSYVRVLVFIFLSFLLPFADIETSSLCDRPLLYATLAYAFLIAYYRRSRTALICMCILLYVITFFQTSTLHYALLYSIPLICVAELFPHLFFMHRSFVMFIFGITIALDQYLYSASAGAPSFPLSYTAAVVCGNIGMLGLFFLKSYGRGEQSNRTHS